MHLYSHIQERISCIPCILHFAGVKGRTALTHGDIFTVTNLRTTIRCLKWHTYKTLQYFTVSESRVWFLNDIHWFQIVSNVPTQLETFQRKRVSLSCLFIKQEIMHHWNHSLNQVAPTQLGFSRAISSTWNVWNFNIKQLMFRLLRRLIVTNSRFYLHSSS